MHDPLDPLLADGVIDEVVARLKSGKEADVWLVRHAGEIVAAKVYRDRDARSFKHNAAYTEGRRVRNSRTQRAIDKGTRFGQAAAEEAWKSREADALYRLHAAGVRVPRPVMFYEGVLLMEMVVDAAGHPAPRLVDAPLEAGQAAALYADLRRQVVGMLCCDLVHGDLSPFNVLVGPEGPVVIDFPQVVDAAQNRQAEGFLQRDLGNLHTFCASLDPALQAARGDAAEIWRAYARRELTPDFVPSGRPPARPQGGGRPDARGGRPGAPRPQGGAPGNRHGAPGGGPQQHPGGRPQQRPGEGAQQRPGDGSPQRPGGGPQQRPAGASPQRPGGGPQQRPAGASPQRPGGGPQQRPAGASLQHPGGRPQQRPGGGPQQQRPGGGLQQRPGGGGARPSGRGPGRSIPEVVRVERLAPPAAPGLPSRPSGPAQAAGSQGRGGGPSAHPGGPHRGHGHGRGDRGHRRG